MKRNKRHGVYDRVVAERLARSGLFWLAEMVGEHASIDYDYADLCWWKAVTLFQEAWLYGWGA